MGVQSFATSSASALASLSAVCSEPGLRYHGKRSALTVRDAQCTSSASRFSSSSATMNGHRSATSRGIRSAQASRGLVHLGGKRGVLDSVRMAAKRRHGRTNRKASAARALRPGAANLKGSDAHPIAGVQPST